MITQCPIHNIEMSEFTKGDRSWFSHRLPDNSWCNGKVKSTPVEAPKTPEVNWLAKDRIVARESAYKTAGGVIQALIDTKIITNLNEARIQLFNLAKEIERKIYEGIDDPYNEIENIDEEIKGSFSEKEY